MDLALGAAEEVVRRGVGDLLDATCPPPRVRAAEPLGFDAELWSQLESAPVPYAGRLTELAVASEEVGKRLAPVPVVEVAVARRLLTASNAPVPSSALPTLALRPVVGDVATLVPAGAVATE